VKKIPDELAAWHYFFGFRVSRRRQNRASERRGRPKPPARTAFRTADGIAHESEG
jgi:hypothetical protein